jgi:hypothetical protein
MAAARDAVKKEALRKAGVRYMEFCATDTEDQIRSRLREHFATKVAASTKKQLDLQLRNPYLRLGAYSKNLPVTFELLCRAMYRALWRAACITKPSFAAWAAPSIVVISTPTCNDLGRD